MTKDKTPIQKLINGKPSEFARRIGCPKSTANHYSDGTRTPREWVYNLIEYALDCGYDIHSKKINETYQRAESVLTRCLVKSADEINNKQMFDCYVFGGVALFECSHCKYKTTLTVTDCEQIIDNGGSYTCCNCIKESSIIKNQNESKNEKPNDKH